MEHQIWEPLALPQLIFDVHLIWDQYVACAVNKVDVNAVFIREMKLARERTRFNAKSQFQPRHKHENYSSGKKLFPAHLVTIRR